MRKNRYDNPEEIFKILKEFKINLSEEEKEKMRKMTPTALHRYKRDMIDTKLEKTLNHPSGAKA